MKNKFIANILLCEEFTKESKCNNFFNYITLEDKKKVSFDIGIFFASDIKEVKTEMFLVNLVYEGDRDNTGGQFHPLGTYTKSFEKTGKDTEMIVFRNNEIEFEWNGLYSLEVRLCKEIKDIESMELEQLI